MSEEKIRTYIRESGEAEKLAREVLTSADSTLNQRKDILDQLNQFTILMRGYFNAIRDILGEEKANYYREYFEQARSKEGLEGEEECP